MVSSPFASPRGLGVVNFFVLIALSRCPCLRGLRLSHSSDLIFAFLQLLITWLSYPFLFLLFSFYSELVSMCVVNVLIKGGIEDQERPRTGGWSLLSDE
jgi:hypothetical protein